jgi:TPR repeat protein
MQMLNSFMEIVFATGRGTSIDMIEVTRYYKFVAAQGHVLGRIYYGAPVEGCLCLSENCDRAASRFKTAADRGLADGQFGSGGDHGHDAGTSVDFVMAAKYFKEVADRGVSDNQVNYGGCLLNGWGVSVNHNDAVRYFKFVVDQGNSYGALNHGLCLIE